MKTQIQSTEKTLRTDESLRAENEKLRAENEQLLQQNKWLMEQLKLIKSRKFGASSEQTNPDQLNLFNEAEALADTAAPEPEITTVKEHTRKKTRLITDKLPEDLPIEVVVHEIPEDERVCPNCNGELHKMGQEVREELKFIPAKAVIIQHVRNVYACRDCEENSDHVPIAKAEMPESVIKGGFASPEAIAHIASQKYFMASPLYRQEQEWKQNGIFLSRQTMANWLIKASELWLEPIYAAMKAALINQDVLHGDETTNQVLHEPGKTAQSNSYMWLYRTSGDVKHHLIVYEYQPSRSHIHPMAFLKDFKGYLHADGYDGYHKLPGRITVVGCWTHMRRKFTDTLKTIPKEKWEGTVAAKGVEYCDRLFYLEKQFVQLSAEERLKKRTQLSKPLVNEFYDWVVNLQALPKSLLGQARSYALSQRNYLERYLSDGRLEISNNRAERSIKPFVIGRKNWLFSNTVNGARSSAIYYSLIVTAKENGMIPFEYLSWIFTNAPNLGKPSYVEKYEDFLPGSAAIPARVFAPKPPSAQSQRFEWEED
jgi:transposase